MDGKAEDVWVVSGSLSQTSTVIIVLSSKFNMRNGCTIYNSKFVLTTDMIVFGVRSSVHYEGYLFFYRALDRHLTYTVLFVV